MTIAEEIREKLYSGSLDTIRAVIYARVSTDNEGQKESCSNQVALAKNYIAEHPNIKLVATYVDDGISGKNDFTRPQYNEMLQQLSLNGFDIIITKALSRLNRDELNSLLLRSMLIEHDASVLTLEDGQIHDFEDINSDLLHSVKYAMDAQYVKQQSINARKTQELRCERKELTAKDCSYGYDWHKEDKSITINEEQADVVRWIFEEYVYRNGTPASIQRQLQQKGISICGRTVSNIILDERYIGNFYINKRTSKLGTGRTKSKRIKLPKEQWVLCERPNLQIVDPDIFEMAQRIHKTRITVYEKPDKKICQARFQGFHLYASKIFCPICGKPYQFGYADRKKTIPVYRIKKHSECSNTINKIYERDLKDITKKALKKTIAEQNTVFFNLEKKLTDVVKATQNNREAIETLKKQHSINEKRIEKLIDRLSKEDWTEHTEKRIKDKLNQLTEESDSLMDKINKLESSKLDDSYVSDKLNDIKVFFVNFRAFNRIDREKIQNYIERIEMPPNGNIEMLLKSGCRIISEHVGKNGIQDAPY